MTSWCMKFATVQKKKFITHPPPPPPALELAILHRYYRKFYKAAKPSSSGVSLHLCIIYRLFYKWRRRHFAQIHFAFIWNNWSFGKNIILHSWSLVRLCQYFINFCLIIVSSYKTQEDLLFIFHSHSPVSIVTYEGVMWIFFSFKIIEASINDVNLKFT